MENKIFALFCAIFTLLVNSTTFNQNFNGKFVLKEKDNKRFDIFMQKMGTPWIFRKVAPALRQELHLSVPKNNNNKKQRAQEKDWIKIDLVSTFVSSSEKYYL